MADLSGTDEERAEQALVAAAGKLVRSTNSTVPGDFAPALLARAVPEDLMRYDARELAELAADAWALLATRKPATSNVRYASPSITAGHPRRCWTRDSDDVFRRSYATGHFRDSFVSSCND